MADSNPVESLTHGTAPGPEGMEDHGHTHHVVPISVYNNTIGMLLLLLFITVGAATFNFEHLGPGWAWANITVAVVIAVIKAALIVWYFMHMKWHSKVVWLFGGAALMWIFIMFVIGFTDYFTRTWIIAGPAYLH